MTERDNLPTELSIITKLFELEIKDVDHKLRNMVKGGVYKKALQNCMRAFLFNTLLKVDGEKKYSFIRTCFLTFTEKSLWI
jgi:hypothetical protein